MKPKPLSGRAATFRRALWKRVSEREDDYLQWTRDDIEAAWLAGYRAAKRDSKRKVTR